MLEVVLLWGTFYHYGNTLTVCKGCNLNCLPLELKKYIHFDKRIRKGFKFKKMNIVINLVNHFCLLIRGGYYTIPYNCVQGRPFGAQRVAGRQSEEG